MWDKNLSSEEREAKHKENILKSKQQVYVQIFENLTKRWTEKGLISADEPLPYNFHQLNKKEALSKQGASECQDLSNDKESEGSDTPLPAPTSPPEHPQSEDTIHQPILVPESIEDEFKWENIEPTLNGCSIIIGMHPDQATEAIVDFAIAFKVIFQWPSSYFRFHLR